MSLTIQTPVSAGELIDKITILRIKQRHIKDPHKLNLVRHELQQLESTMQQHIDVTPQLEATIKKLADINQRLWNIEDDIRQCERQQDFGDRFIQLARQVYYTNDERAASKAHINTLTHSDITEVKSYEAY